MPDRTLVRTIIAAVIATAIGIYIGFEIHWFPAQASSQAHKIDDLYKVLIVATVPIFVLVCTVILYSVWQFRMKPGQEGQDGPPIHGNTRLEIVWTLLPAILILGLVSYSFVVLHDIEKKSAREMQVKVIGQQFAWAFQYPAAAGGQPVQSDVLYLPLGESVQFSMTSKDVIHAFWVPAFRIQQDVVPGITTHYRITPTKLGTYDGVCNELCGLGHATMRTVVHVVTAAQFQTWLQGKRSASTTTASTATGTAAGGVSPSGAAGAPPPAKPSKSAPAGAAASPALVAAGKQVFTGSSGCAGCHTLADAGSTATIGPNLGQVLSGPKHTAAFIRTSIVSPNAYVEKGFSPGIMPQSFGSTLSKQQLNALVAYLLKVSGP
jgi:cytochrome c oxidase subunit 2